MSLRSGNTHGHVTRAILCGNLQEKCRTPFPGSTFCASLRSRNAHGHFTRAILWKFTGKMPHTTPPTSIKHRAFYPYRKNPFSVATLFGEHVGETVPNHQPGKSIRWYLYKKMLYIYKKHQQTEVRNKIRI